MKPIIRTTDEIEEVESAAISAIGEGSRFPGMTYEDGIDAVLRWLVEEDADHPFEE